MLDYKKAKEFQLPDMPHAVRTYPASAGTTMMPLTPANNWTATILFCGGSDIKANQWKPNWDIPNHTASASCVSITPDVSTDYQEEEDLPEGRSMGNLIMLPNGKILMLNGAATGVAGYGNDSIAVGQSYADNPLLTPIIYDPSAPKGQRWSRDGLSPSTIPRMYHSSATLLPDGSIFVAGSNPNADYTTDVKFKTEYRVERFYPSYYNERRPQPQGLLTQYSYGGPYFNVTLTKDDLSGNSANVNNTQVIIIRTGFSTHAMVSLPFLLIRHLCSLFTNWLSQNMGQRMLQLENSYTVNNDGSATLHVSQLPPNPAIFQPGPAREFTFLVAAIVSFAKTKIGSPLSVIFVVVNGVPSVGVQVMLGSGQLETQKTLAIAPLPASGVAPSADDNTSKTGDNRDQANGAPRTLSLDSISYLTLLLLVPLWTLLGGL